MQQNDERGREREMQGLHAMIHIYFQTATKFQYFNQFESL